MKKNPSAATSGKGGWRRLGATAMLACFIAGQPFAVVHAQDPSSNQATLNFVGADIDSVVKAIGHYTRTTFVIDPRVKGTINLVSEQPVSKAQALDMLGSALRLQGYAMVRSGTVTKVVPEAEGKLQAGPIQTGEVRGDQIATQIFRLSYESANNLVQILRPLISPNNTINVNPGNNSIVITDYADNLRRLGRIIASLDVPATGDMDVVPVRHAVATDIAVMVNRLMEGAAAPGAADPGRVSVLADARTNSLIIRAPSPARASLARSLIQKLDQPTAQPGNVHVVYLRNADAVRLAQTLRAVVAGDSSSQPGGQATQQQQPQQQNSGLNSNTGNQQGGLGQGAMNPSGVQTPVALPTGGPGGFIQADPATNTLIITASEAVYRNLRTVIDQLDARRAQVYVESLIVEVSAEKAAELGVQWLGLSGDDASRYRVGGGTAFSTGGNNIINQVVAANSANGTLAPPGNGLTLGVFRQINGALGLGALARALETDAGANILSIPNLITLDNEEARIIVGQNVPFITGQYTTQASGGAAGVNPFQTVERRDVGLSLRVRPQISEGGTIKLAIYQETSSIRDTTNAAGIITNKRSIESNVLVDDGQVIVLGGLIQEEGQDGNEKVPGLGDVPVLGNLFKYQTRRNTKTNLMVFLRPTVIRTAEQSVDVMANRYDYIRGVQTQGQRSNSLLLPNAVAPTLPPMQDGQPVGGAMLNIVPQRSPQQAPPQQAPQQPGVPASPAPIPNSPAPPPEQNLNRTQ
ncbi:MAG TPA: type II secretion system secretin GspD [Noviherbaspirillum sp.]|jgi:general secretion pathway protein D|uniref:type II secretion system secretin GspD n=1 Tax=Noviherbaspirillum sp. TaxID=1926288 RepID=UPI002F92CE7D